MLVETDVEYTGERPSVLGFIFMFKDIIFRMDASVLRFIVMETTIAVLLSFAAMYCTPDEEFSGLGHQFVGMLLSFLTVFRSNTSYHLWEDGRIMLGRINSASRIVANEILGVAAEGAVADGTPTLSDEAHECVRLLKLFYFVVVEHVRSTDGHEPWVFAQNVASRTRRRARSPRSRRSSAWRSPAFSATSCCPPRRRVATAWRPPQDEGEHHPPENRYYSQAESSADASGAGGGTPAAAAIEAAAAAGHAANGSPASASASAAGARGGVRPRPSFLMNPHDPTRQATRRRAVASLAALRVKRQSGSGGAT